MDQGDAFDVSFCTIGTPQPTTLTENEMRPVEVEYVEAFAKLSRSFNVRYFAFTSFVNASPQSSKSPMAKLKGEAELAIKMRRFERTSMFRLAWIATPKPVYAGSVMHYAYSVVDHYLRHYFRMTPWLMYVPVSVIGSQSKSVDSYSVASAMVNDAEAFLSGQDAVEQSMRIGWPGLRRFHYEDIMRMAASNNP